MSSALLPSTQVTVTFSVQVSTDRDSELLTLLFILLAPIFLLMEMKRRVHRFWNELVLSLADLKDLLIFIGKVIAITFNSFAFGLGIRR